MKRSFLGIAVAIAAALPMIPSSPVAAADPVTVQILGINDFHGRIASNGVEAGAAVLSGAVKQLRTQYPNTVFAAAGDLVGASTFESFIAHDKPTIDALNAAGLQVSAVGNHEFDQGYADLTQRIMAPYDAVTNPYGGAAWAYIGANVRNSSDGSPALPESWIQEFGTIKVGFVGAVTDHLAELVSPAGIAGLTIEAPVVAANREADKLKAQGADIIILLVHEGAATTSLASATDPASDFGKIVNGVDENIDAIISGHTHLAYNHSIPVPAWISEGRSVTNRPVVSAGQYGYNLNQLVFTVDGDTDRVLGVNQTILPLTTTAGTPPITTANYPADPAVTPIVSAATAQGDVLGAVELGQIQGPFYRARILTSPTATTRTDSRGGESTLGNLVADAQVFATKGPITGSAQISLMNPGGLRTDLLGIANGTGTYPTPLTYKQSANVQPFANTLVNMTLTGAQLKTALEQQWQPAGSSRPILHLGLSKGFTYTYDPSAANGSHITQMFFNGALIAPTDTYSVTVNSFLAAGGDNFFELANGTNKRDTGQTDLQAMVDYMAATTPLAVDFRQHSVGVQFPVGSPATYSVGSTVAFNLSSLSFTGPGDVVDTTLALSIDGVSVGTAAVVTTLTNVPNDEHGLAAVSFVVPSGISGGAHRLTITGTTTGTNTSIPLTITASSTTTLSTNRTSQTFGWPGAATLTAKVAAGDGSVVTGSVEFRSGATVLGTAAVVNGKAALTLPTNTPAGTWAITATYLGSATVLGSTSASVNVTVNKAPSLTLLLPTGLSQKKGTARPITLIGLVSTPFVGTSGSIQFKQDGVVVATVPVNSGIAFWTLPSSLAVGNYRFTATFVPTDAANVAGSTSNTIPIRVTK